MIRRYKSTDVIKILEFLESNVQMLIMFQANVVNKKNYAYECHVSENNDVIDSVIISQYDTSFIKLTAQSDVEEIASFLRFNPVLMMVKGESVDIDRIAKYFPEAESEPYVVSKLSQSPNMFNAPYIVKVASDIKDLRSVYALLKDNGMQQLSFDEFYMAKRESIIELKSRSYVACDGDKIVATASTLYEMLPLAFLGAVATDKMYQNKGVAKMLVSNLCDKLINDGFIPYIACSNQIAAKVYEDIGFKEILKCKTLK